MFFLLLVLVGFGAIFTMYYIFFPQADNLEQARNSQSIEELEKRIRSGTEKVNEQVKENEVLREQLNLKEEENKNIIRARERQFGEEKAALMERIGILNKEIESLKEEIKAKAAVKETEEVLKVDGLAGSEDTRELEIIEEESGKQDVPVSFELNDRQKEVMEYLKEKGKITRREYCDEFEVSIPTAARDLKELQDRDLIKPHGPLGPGRYFILVRTQD